MLAPRDTPTRQIKSLSGLWRFCLDAAGEGRTAGWSNGLPAGSREMPVPASYNDVYPEAEFRDHVGDAWYETTVHVPSTWSDERIVLRFGSATHRAVVWINGTQVATHEGGYTPFEADVTDVVKHGAENLITVVVNNELTWQSIPPGYVEQTPDGPRQKYFHDFFNYAGLHRAVVLYTTPPAYVSDVTVVTGVDGKVGIVRFEIETANAEGLEVRVTLRDTDSVEVATAIGPSGELAVADAKLWKPGEGYLHQLDIELWGSDDTPIDVYPIAVGIRSVEVAGNRFLINGEPFTFRGFGRHEDSVLRGKGHDDVFMVHDFALMEWVGANSFRTSHYPYAEEVLDYADRRGFVVIDEAPAVGLNMALAGGLFTTFSDDTINADTQAVHRRAIEELIARDKNHPCVVLWSIANEPESTSSASRAYFEPLAARTRQLDPSRPIGFVNVMLAPPSRDIITDLFDVIMLNRYYGWYVNTGDLPAAERALEAELHAWKDKHDMPIIVTEYGADTLPGMHGITAVPWNEEYQSELLAMSHRVFDRIDSVIGEQIWNFADFDTTPGIMRVGGNKKGVFTRDRNPKAAVHVLRRRWREVN